MVRPCNFYALLVSVQVATRSELIAARQMSLTCYHADISRILS